MAQGYTHLHAKVVWKMARKKMVGGHNRQQDTIANWFESSKQGEVKEALDEMVTDPSAPIKPYGGTRDAVVLVGMGEAKDFIEEHYDPDKDDFWTGVL